MKVWPLTFKQFLSDKINQIFKTNYIQYQLVHHSIVSGTQLSKHLTALQLGFNNGIYTYTLNAKSLQGRDDDFLGIQRNDNHSLTRFHEI